MKMNNKDLIGNIYDILAQNELPVSIKNEITFYIDYVDYDKKTIFIDIKDKRYQLSIKEVKEL